MANYIADQSWSQEPKRLNALETSLDQNSVRYLRGLGALSNLRCLEVGAGSGSLARWLAEQVGPQGSVLATDIDVTLLRPLTALHPNLQVRREDIAESVPTHSDGRPFDLAHARLVLGHLAQPERALQNIVRALRPGGWVLIEDADFLWTELGEQPLYPRAHMQPYFEVWREVVLAMRERGYAVHWGRRLAGALRDAGLEQVAGEAVMSVGDVALQRAMRMTIERFATPLVQAGRIGASALAECLSALDDPALVFTSSPTFSIWGRRPLVSHSERP